MCECPLLLVSLRSKLAVIVPAPLLFTALVMIAGVRLRMADVLWEEHRQNAILMAKDIENQIVLAE